jgi:hypothetical protein
LNRLDIKVKDDEWWCKPNWSRIYYYNNLRYNTLDELNVKLSEYNINISDVNVGEKKYAHHFGECRYIWTFKLTCNNISYSIKFTPKELKVINAISDEDRIYQLLEISPDTDNVK